MSPVFNVFCAIVESAKNLRYLTESETATLAYKEKILQIPMTVQKMQFTVLMMGKRRMYIILKTKVVTVMLRELMLV
jgi:hypothetical protein